MLLVRSQEKYLVIETDVSGDLCMGKLQNTT